MAVLEHANRLWEFFCSDRTHEPCDAIVVCCSYDLRVCDYACELIFRGVAQRLVLSGKTGNWTKHLWSEPRHEYSTGGLLRTASNWKRSLLKSKQLTLGRMSRFRAICYRGQSASPL
jgi:hypothetical protein